MYRLQGGRRGFLWLLYLLHYLLLAVAYVLYVGPVWAHRGYALAPDPLRIALSVAAVVVVGWLVQWNGRPSAFFTTVFGLTVFVPVAVIYSCAGGAWGLVLIAGVALMIMLVVGSVVRIPVLPCLSWSCQQIFSLLGVLSIICIAAAFAWGGARYFNIDPRKVYEYRTATALAMPVAFSYLFPFVGKLAIPAMLAIALEMRRWAWCFLCLLLTVLVFGITSHKGNLFYPLMILAMWAVFRMPSPLLAFAATCVMAVAVGLLDFVVSFDVLHRESAWIGSLAVRRSFIVPADLSFAYYDFFSASKYITWATSKITLGLLVYPYEVSPPYLIGQFRYGQTSVAANVGLLGSGYMHAGMLGVLVYTLVVATVLGFLDSCAVKRKASLVCCIVFPSLMTAFLSSDLTTTFLTHGLLMALLLVFVLPASDQKAPEALAAIGNE